MAIDSQVKKAIDEAANKDGFHFFIELGGNGNYLLYFNEDHSFWRVYDPITGKLKEEGEVKSNSRRNFFNPEKVTNSREVRRYSHRFGLGNRELDTWLYFIRNIIKKNYQNPSKTL